MTPHTCEAPNYCICYQLADEPDEDCPVHGYPKHPQNCMVCGRFLKRPNIEEIVVERIIRASIEKT